MSGIVARGLGFVRGRWPSAIFAMAALGVTIAAQPGAMAQAQDWPAKPIKLIVAFSAGGTADIFARLLAPELADALKQQVIVENRPGSSGATGSAAVAAAEPDGHTLLMCGSGPQFTAPAINPNVGYDPLRGFTHLGMVAGDGYVLIARPGASSTSLAAFKAAGLTSIATGSPGAGSLGHLLIEQAKRKVGLDLIHVPYKSSGDGIKDLLGGHIGLVMSPVVNALEQVKAGQVVALAATSAERNKALPDVPTFKELGFDVQGSTWFWLCGPKALPNPIADRLAREVARIVNLPSIKARFERDALLTPDYDRAGLERFVAAEIALWAPLIKEIGLKVQ